MKVSHASQPPPVKRLPFAVPFSDKRRAEADCYDRREPPPPRTKSLAQIVNAPPRKLCHGQRWGDWHLDACRLTVDYKPDGVWRYEMDLERVWDSASLLDWIFQIHGKGFADEQTRKDLLDALHDIFLPQANLCTCGIHRELPESFLATRIEPPTEAQRDESYRQARQTYEAWGIPIPDERGGTRP